ncbi:cyclic peptide export ABC transporter [Leptolyngbyaceae cyanobacterium CCMR0082]|uniref:Cyclic peptide export ABC transporter n=2 Tax=Adonisia turfae TaxID=2950184 RepID=A0A6M0SGB3_9CYAN|nr:cyclic peptide export ABC transporter [Adonisia turfae]NEZ59377.1 cyclic peptide export ABC transporter [Adonisia turfae CCMR0081]NEZ67434.1 cyclic peptide export ABC transporter [Adonisia turfae CCMR0082]
MNLISLLLRTSPMAMVIAIVAGGVSGGGSARLVALVNEVIAGRQATTASFFLGFLGLLAIVLVAGYLSQLLLIRLGQGALLHLRLMLARQLLDCPLRQLEDLGSHRLFASLTADVETIASAFTVVPFLCIDLAIVGGSLLYLGWLSVPLLLIMVAFLLLATVTYQLIARRARRFLVKARNEQDRLFKHLRGLIHGMKELKLHQQRRQVFLTDELQQTATTYRRFTVWGMGIFAGAASWGQLIFFAVISVFLFVIPQFSALDMTLFSSYVLTVIYLNGPLENLMRRLPILSRASVALDKVESFGFMLNQFPELPSIESLSPSWQHLELKNVVHHYDRGADTTPFTVGPINLAFKRPEVVFLIGGNGSGKSTLAKLITGLYPPSSGQIILDGNRITDANREAYRQQFSAIFADFYLFDRLLALDNPQQIEQANAYLQALQLAHKVHIQDGKLSDIDLSQGQRKRLALLTTYLEDRPVYLFDEWAADQDPHFKTVFYTQILPELKRQQKLVLAITHDDKYFHLADRILKLESGQLADSSMAKVLS